MIEDKLTHAERLRLECLAQATAKNAMKPHADVDQVIADAKKIVDFVGGPARARLLEAVTDALKAPEGSPWSHALEVASVSEIAQEIADQIELL